MKSIYTIVLALCFSLNLSFAQTNLTEAVDFTVTTVHGETYNLFELLDEGKHVVIDFFFTTCGPCISSVPEVNSTFERFGCNKGEVFFIAIDQGDSDAQVLQYEEDYGGLLPSVSGVEGGGNQVNTDYGIGAYPTIILIAPDRSIVSQDIFPVTMENFDAALIDAAGLEENPEACLLTNTEELEIISGTTVLGAFPNPAVDVASISLELENSAEISIEVFNLLGQRVATVANTQYAAGSVQIDLPMENLTGGTYLVNVMQENILVEATKLVVVR